MDATRYRVGTIIKAASARVEKAETKPPPYYTEQSLLDDMCTAHRFARTDEDREILRRVAGIGTARTRASIIEGLIRRGLIERKKAGKSQQLHITHEGRQVLQKLPDSAKDVALTAKWERALGMIAEGKASGDQLIAKVEQTLQMVMHQMMQNQKKA